MILHKNFTVFVFGFISGFVLLISGNSLNFWLASEGVNIGSIGLFSVVALPYAISFLWAPFLDRFTLPYFSKIFGYRLSWIYLLQILLSISVYIMSLCSPTSSLFILAICSCVVAFFSSTQDVAIGALRSEIIDPADQGVVSGFYVLGYRIGMLLSGSGAIFCSSILSWAEIYKIFALVILLFPVIIYCTLNGTSVFRNIKPYARQNNSIWNITKSLNKSEVFIYIIVFLILYRLPDNFIHAMINPFLLHLGFDALEIASVGKFLGVLSSILGGFLGSYVMRTKSIITSLIIFGIIHAVAHLLFVMQNFMGDNLISLFFVMGFESITGGMAMASYMAFITSLCTGNYRATKYAFLTSLMGLSRSLFPGIAGFFVLKYGWSAFYICASIASIPSILVIYRVQKLNKTLRVS